MSCGGCQSACDLFPFYAFQGDISNSFWVDVLLMGFQDVVFLPSRASFSATFLKNCGRGESHETAYCLRTVVRGKQGHAPSKIFLIPQSLFLCHSNLI